MKRIFSSLVILTLFAFLGGCGISAPSTTAGKGYINILVMDAPPKNEVTAIMVTVSSISVHLAGAEETTTPPTTTTPTVTATDTATSTSTATTTSTESSTDEGRWINIPISGPNPFNLLELQGINELLGTAQLEAGRYTQLRLEVSKIGVALDGGALQKATLPSGELKFVRPFDIIAGETTDVKLDFDAQKSVNVTGSGKVMVKPVVKLDISIRSSNQLGSLSGAVNAVDIQASTISILPNGQTQPIVFGITPQTVIILNGAGVELADLAALAPGSTATVSYYLSSLKAVRIEIETPPATVSAI